MPNYNCPILVWQDAQGLFTACPVEPETNLAGTGRNAGAAVEQVRKYLDWSYRNDPCQIAPDILDPELASVTVDVRPEFQEYDRVYPCPERFSLEVPCVIGRRQSGLRVCSTPLFGLQFDHDAQDSFSELMQEHVRAKLAGSTPRQLSRYLKPDQIQLKNLTIRVPTEVFHRSVVIQVPVLEKVADPIDRRRGSQRFGRAWLREAIVASLVTKLLADRTSILLVGERGVGKTTILVEAVREAARRAREIPSENDSEKNDGQPATPHSRFWMTSAARLIAGMPYLGEWQSQCEEVIENLASIQGVLCFENLLDLLRSGGQEASDSIAAFLLPFLEHGDLRIVGEATPEELDAFGRLLPGLLELLHKMPIEPLTQDQSIQALHLLLEPPGQKNTFEVDDDVVDTVCRLHRRFLPYQTLPGPAARFLQDMANVARRKNLPRLSANLIREEFGRRSGLPELFLRDDLPLKLKSVRDQLRDEVIGQEQAVESASHVITTFKAGLNDPNRPVAVLLFCGPTGVGKTELAKAISRFCFGRPAEDSLSAKTDQTRDVAVVNRGNAPGSDRLLRLDMSEFAGPGSADRLVTQPDGQPTRFIEQIRQQPFQVILLDEIEKASSAIFDVLLNVFEEGRLTDRWGRTTSFKSSIIIMTSNLGADRATPVGFGESTGPNYERVATQFFRPEFYNRIDELIAFQGLDTDVVRSIVRKELGSLASRELLREPGTILSFTDELVDFIVRHGFDERYGARPLQRFIESFVVGQLARYVIDFGDPIPKAIELSLSNDQQLQITPER